jgi:hypothetical protein
LEALEHLLSHALCTGRHKPDDIDSKIASKYTGVDRDHLRFIRRRCGYCNSGINNTTTIYVNDSPTIQRLLTASRTLGPKSYPFVKSTSISTSMSCGESTDFGINAVTPGLAVRYSSVFWIGCGDDSAKPIPTQMLQHRLTSAANSAFLPSCFLPGKATQLQRIAGPTFLSSNSEHVTVHQSIVTASFLADITESNVEFQTSKWLQRQIQDNRSRLESGTLLLLAWRRHEPESCTMQDIFKRFEGSESRDIRIFPSTHELDHAQEKLGDIRALDQIADCAPSGWSFRPVTCDNMSECRLGVNGVLKRTHSCGSDHVILHPTASDVSKHLQCLSRQRRMSTRRACQGVGRWFHQEFVEDLISGGEFRVFVITREDLSALRKRRGVVMEIIHTLELPDKELVVTVLHPNLVWRGKTQERSSVDFKELQDFALYVFDALRDRPDWSRNYESLEIGVRLDIGMSLASGRCSYFVNEITRIYEADFFAEWLAQPGTHICKAVAEAIQEVFMVPSSQLPIS